MRKSLSFKIIITFIFGIGLATNIIFAQTSIQIIPNGPAKVGDSLEIEIKAIHTKDIKQLSIVIDNDYIGKKIVNGNGKSLNVKTRIFQPYEGKKLVTVTLWEFPNAAIKEEKISLEFKCYNEYCSPDPQFIDFFTWMREKKYSECIVSHYLKQIEDSEKRDYIKRYIAVRNKRPLQQVMNIQFYDIIPNDANAIYEEMSSTNATTCYNNPNWPLYCPNPVKADHKFLEEKLSKTFGVKYNLTYQQQTVNYVQTFGLPDNNGEFDFIKLNIFENQFPQGSIVHYAAKKINNLNVAENSRGTFVARMFSEAAIWNENHIYAHELGHVYGLPHSFVDGTVPVKFFCLDGVMSNGYHFATALENPLDPLERYALEPVNGYLDDATFVNNYDLNIIKQSYLNNQCTSTDPAVTSLKHLYRKNGKNYFEVCIGNLSNQNCAFPEYRFFYNNHISIERRTLESLKSGQVLKDTISIDETLGISTFTAGVDPDHLINEINETNNELTITLTSTADELHQKITVFPNPSSDYIVINGYKDDLHSLKLFDIHGKENNIIRNHGTIDISGLRQGLYFLHCVQDQRKEASTQIIKIVKM